MSNKIALLKDNAGFEFLKIQGRDSKILRIPANTIKPVKVLCQHAGRIATRDGEIRYVSARDLKKLMKDMGSQAENIHGFIVPVPKVSGPVWNNRLAKMSGEICEDMLYQLFDPDIEKSSIRSWYYETAGKYIMKTYMLPLKRLAKSMEKEIIFDLGNIEMQYDLMKKMINPAMLKKAEISIAVHKNGNVEKELGFSGRDYVINEQFLERTVKKDAKILLITPTRGIMERFCQGEIKKKANRLETPALLSAIEGVYYSDMLEGKGYSFDVTDEFHLPKMSDLKEYENILICKSCLFTEKERKKIDKLQKYGVKINHKDLICDLTQKGEG